MLANLEFAMHSSPGNVRVELVDPRTGAPLRVTDASGKAFIARVTVGHEGS